MIAKYKLYISIFTIWLFTISGIIGISSSYQDWFLQLTYLNLFLYFVLILFNIKQLSYKFFLAFSIPFFIGFITEFLGTNYGWFFGEYLYGENLGTKIGGVPIMICINWGVLTIITADIAKLVHKNIFVVAIIGAFLMTALDVVIEVSAPRFDFWEFKNTVVPLKNYVAWFIISFIAHLLYHQFNIKTNTKISVHIFIAITLFFAVFLFI
jgi:putative membrane protein